MCLFKCITGLVSENPLAVNVLKQKHILILVLNIPKNPKFKDDDRIPISKYKNIFSVSYTPNWIE